MQSMISREGCDESLGGSTTGNKPVSKGLKVLETQLAEWIIQVLQVVHGDYKNDASLPGVSVRHINVMLGCLSAFKDAEQYNEASMWGRLLTTCCL